MAADDPAATLSEEQRRAASSGEKAFMPIAGRSFLDHVVDRLRAAGIDEIGVVVGPERRAEWAIGGLTPIVQSEPLGTAHAVLAAEVWAGPHPFLVLNGDNLYPVDAIAALCELDGPGVAGFDRDDLVATGNIPPERIAAFALIDTDESGRLRRIVEKPSPADLASLGPSRLVSMNLWRLDPRIFAACRDVAASPRGEFELPSAVMLARDRGVAFAVVPSAGPVLDLSRRGDVADVARRLSEVGE